MFEHVWFPTLTLPGHEVTAGIDEEDYLLARGRVQRQLNRLNVMKTKAKGYFASCSKIFPNYERLVANVVFLVEAGRYDEATSLLFRSLPSIVKSMDILEELTKPFLK